MTPSVDGDSEDEFQVEEESPCGRWHKRKETVPHRLHFQRVPPGLGGVALDKYDHSG